MATIQEFELLSAESHCVIARHPGRHHPGVLVQGDTLRALLDDVEELIDEMAAQELQSAKEIILSIHSRIVDTLGYYERTLDSNGLEIPYANRVIV